MTAFDYTKHPPASAYAFAEWREVCKDIDRDNVRKYLSRYKKALRTGYAYATSIPAPASLEDNPRLYAQLCEIDAAVESAFAKLIEICDKENV
jgi:hypothetical protein